MSMLKINDCQATEIMRDEFAKLRADNAKLIEQRDELLVRLTNLERVAGLGPNYDDPARELARAAITKHSPTTKEA